MPESNCAWPLVHAIVHTVQSISLSRPIILCIYLTLHTFRIRFLSSNRVVLTPINPQCNQLTSAFLSLPYHLNTHQKPFEAKAQEGETIHSSDYLLPYVLHPVLILMKILISYPNFDESRPCTTPEAKDGSVVVSIADSSFLHPQVSSAS